MGCESILSFGMPSGALQVSGGRLLTPSLQNITDQGNNISALNLSTAGASIGFGTLTANGMLTVKGSGANIVSFRDSSNNERFYIDSGGSLRGGTAVISTAYFTNLNIGAVGNGIRASADGKINLLNATFNNFTSLTLGLETVSFPSLKVNGARIDIRLGNDSGYAGLTSGIGANKAIEIRDLGGAGLGFFGKTGIIAPTTAYAPAAEAAGGGGAILEDTTFNGYTVSQAMNILTDIGILT